MADQKIEAPLSGPLVDSLPLELTSEDEEFLVASTGIKDRDVLREHVLQIQADAMKVFPYPCIWRFDFVSSHIQNLPRYQTLLALAKERPDALILDIGCGFGQDIRRLMLDGYPPQNIIASDLRRGLWESGLKFFRSNLETFPVKFIQGDVLDPGFTLERPDASSDTLPGLRGRLTFIHASYFFHLWQEEDQLRVARNLAAMLSPVKGSMILGTHIGRRVKGVRVAARAPAPGCKVGRLFCHSPESWKEMWKEIFPGDDVVVEVRMVEDRRPDLANEDPTTPFLLLQWAVTRV